MRTRSQSQQQVFDSEEVLHGVTDRFNPRLDELRSEAGRSLMTAAASGATIMTVPTGMAFQLKFYSIWKTGAAGRVQIGASAAGATRRTLIYRSMANSTFTSESDLAGLVVIASTTQRAFLRASTILGRGFIRIGGILRRRTANETTSP